MSKGQIKILIIIIEALLVSGSVFSIYYFDTQKVIKHHAVKALLSFVFYVISIDLIRRVINYIYKTRRSIPYYKNDNFNYGINNISRFIIFLGLIATIFGLFGIDLKSLLTSLSIVAAAIAIITKDYITDFMIGLYFSFSKEFEINDYVQFGTQKGKVHEISMLKIKLLNDDDDLVIIPNSKIYGNDIINYTKKDIRSLSIDFQIDIQSVQSIEALENDLISALSDFDEYLERESFNLKIVELKKDYIDIKFQYILKKFDRELQSKIRRKTVRRVFNFLSEKAIQQPK